MAVTLMELLASYTQLGVYSHIRAQGDRLQRFFGMEIGGKNNTGAYSRGRMFAYNYFDNTRNVATFRSPGTGPATVTQQVVGQVVGNFGRTHEKLILPYEMLGNLRPIDANAPLDADGQKYIARQQKFLYQKFVNAREVAVRAMMNGYLGWIINNADAGTMTPVYSGGGIHTNFNVPAGNLNQLQDSGGNTILTTGWQNASANIPANLAVIEQTSEYQTSDPISHVWTDSSVWNYVLNNSAVQQLGGSAATAYVSWDMEEEKGPDGNPIRYFKARLKCYPHLLWHIYNAGLNVNGTFTRFFNGTQAVFVPEPSDEWVSMGIGSEFVIEYPGQAAEEQKGFFAWGKTSDEPAAINLLALDNFGPLLFRPSSQFAAVVVF